MSPPHEIYASELAWLKCGYPLWFPEPNEVKGEVEIGDVGFIKDGAFTRVFNICQDKDSALNSNGVPDNFECLKYNTKDHLQTIIGAIQGTVSSQSAKGRRVEAQAGGDAGGARAEIKYEYTCSRSKAAMLLLNPDAHMQLIQPNTRFPEFIKRHHQDWVRYIREVRDFDVDASDVVVARGWYKTDQWTVAAVDRTSRSHRGAAQFSLSLIAAGAGVDVEESATHQADIISRRGPRRIGSGLRLSSYSPAPCSEPKCDQCVFLPHYKVKYRFWGLKSVQASAGYHGLPDNEDDHAGGAGPVVTTDAGVQSGHPIPTSYAPLDIVLDYILQNSDAEVAIACEDDISSLFPGKDWPLDLGTWLTRNRPTIVVEGGAGTLSLEEAIQKERLYEIRSRARPWQQENMQVDDDNFSGPPTVAERDLIIGKGELVLGRNMPRGPPTTFYHLHLYDKEAEGGSVSSTTVSPVNDLLATSSDDSYVRLWNTETGQMVKKWEGHEDCVWSVTFSPDGRFVASASADTTIRIWNTTAPDHPPQVIEGHEADVWTVVYSPDGKKLASGSVDFTVKIWDTTTLQEIHSLESQSANIMHIAWTADSKRVISCVDDTGRIWDADSGALLAEMHGHEGSIWCLSVSKSGDRVITGSEDTTSRIWNTHTGEELVTLHEHTEPVWAVAFSPDDREVVTGSYDRTLSVNDSWSGEVHMTLNGGSGTIDSAAFSTSGKYLASGSADGRIQIWERGTGSLLGELRGHEDKVKSLTFSRDDRDIYSSSDDGSVRVWSVRDVVRLA